jgi:hypothetical protein
MILESLLLLHNMLFQNVAIPGRVQCKFLCLYVVVNIANEDKKLQTPADIIPLYARKI